MRGHIKLFLLATVVALACRCFFIEDYRIISDSMAPSLLSGDLVFVSKFDFNVRLPFSTYEVLRFRGPRRGEVITFTLPERGMQTFVKRVIAVGGDKVAIRKGILEVNGALANYAPSGTEGVSVESFSGGAAYLIRWNRTAEKDYGPVEIPDGHFFALGDNRDESVDSRNWGPVPVSCLKGRVAFVWLSLDSDGKLRRGRSGLRIDGAYAQQAKH